MADSGSRFARATREAHSGNPHGRATRGGPQAGPCQGILGLALCTVGAGRPAKCRWPTDKQNYGKPKENRKFCLIFVAGSWCWRAGTTAWQGQQGHPGAAPDPRESRPGDLVGGRWTADAQEARTGGPHGLERRPGGRLSKGLGLRRAGRKPCMHKRREACMLRVQRAWRPETLCWAMFPGEHACMTQEGRILNRICRGS